MKTPKSQRLQVVCAWCKKLIKEVEMKNGAGGVSHGICEDCKKIILKIQAEEENDIVPTYWRHKD